MQSESEDLSSFQEMVNVKLFFSGAQRRKIVEETKKAIFNAVPVITITGDEGSGKTMICRMVEKELPLDYSCVYMANTPESFDDVVHILARILGTENSQNLGSGKDLVAEIAKYLEENDHRLVAIFDQSERMYLAILERIRKMLDQINSKKVLFHIILAGRQTLLENLKQLTICNFKSVKEESFSLNPLGQTETYAYLNSAVHQRSSTGKNIFTPEAAKKIYTLAQGNFRLTNMMAEKSLESSDPETSFMVLLENVKDGGSAVGKLKNNGKFFELVFVRNKWLSGAVALLLIVSGVLFFSGDDVKDDVLVKDKENKKEIVAVAPKKEISEKKAAPPVQEKLAPKIHDENTEKLVVGQEETVALPKSNDNLGGDTVVEEPEKIVAKPSEVEETQPLQTVDNVGISQQNEDQQVDGDVARTVSSERKKDITDEEKSLVPVEEVTVIEEETVPLKSQIVEETESVDIAVPPPSESPTETKVLVEAIEVVSTVNNEAEIREEEKGPSTVPAIVEEKTELAEKPAAAAVAEERKSQPAEVQAIASAKTELNGDRDTVVLEEKSEEMASPETPEKETVALSESRKRKPQQLSPETGAKKIVRIAPATVNLPEPEVIVDSENQAEQKNLDQLYQQRVEAASRWISDNSSDKHTVQLMVLTSEQAEENLKKRFEQEDYREIADNLYVIKNIDDSSVFVFYGEYADPDSARKARNTLPIFLRKHNPYILSVENAVKKATSP